MLETRGGEQVGLFSALRNIAATLLANGKTRLELLSNEIEVEKLRAIRLLVMALGMVFCFGVGIILAVVFLMTMFWEQRLAVAGLSVLFFLGLGGVFLSRFQLESRRTGRIFSASLAELERDLHELKGKLKAMAGHEPPGR